MMLKNPPIMQLALTVSFTPSLDSLSIIDLAELYSEFRGDFPIYAQVQRAGPMSYSPFEADETKGSMPRILFSSEDTSSQVAFQNDRLTVLWRRTTPLTSEPKYPGFGHVVELYFKALVRLQGWLRAKGLPEIVPAVGELAYVDAFSVEDRETHKPRAISDILNIFSSEVIFPILTFSHNWTEPLRGKLDGYIRVEIDAPTQLADGEMVVSLDTTVSFNPGDDWMVAERKFSDAHEAALQVFDRVVNPNAVAMSA